MARHEPGKIWALRRTGKFPNGWVETENEKEIRLGYQHDQLGYRGGFICSRPDARLFAKRILECLEATK